jgi:hypothetical protein
MSYQELMFALPIPDGLPFEVMLDLCVSGISRIALQSAQAHGTAVCQPPAHMQQLLS